MTGTEYAVEADPGRLTASFPLGTLEEVERSACHINARRPDLPPVRVVMRPAGSKPGTPFVLYDAFRSFRMPPAEAEFLVATGAADEIVGNPFKTR